MNVSLLFAVVVAFLGHVAWILSNCSSFSAGGDTCLIAKGLAPYIDGVMFLVAWAVGYVVERELPETVRQKLNRWIAPGR
jgi:hypothetical protein